ncbi:hypothetical protein ACFSO7_02350 [Bacillus sp. CGMCC 1.16607]|uniref:hypothetical protein n=1 Tax=Bacillus sp. CGMCC 1.16607 TaxID=3351842 RepID=UPI00363CBBBC
MKRFLYVILSSIMVLFFLPPQHSQAWSDPVKTENWSENLELKSPATSPAKKSTTKAKPVVVNPRFSYGKWKLWIPGTMIDYFYKDTGQYKKSKYTKGAYNGTLTINSNGTYQLNNKKGKWRKAKTGEVFNYPNSIILAKGIGNYDVAVSTHKSKKGYIILLTDSKGKYTDGSKIWLVGAEGFK